MHYTYKLIDPRNGKVFYVGKGTGDRYKYHIKTVKRGSEPNNNGHLYNKIKSILEESYEDVKYEIEEYENEQKAFEAEQELISEIGYNNLCNLTKGGLGGDALSEHPNKEQIYEERELEPWNKGKSYEELWGEEKAKKFKEQISKTKQGGNGNQTSFKSGEEHRYYGEERPEVGEKISETLEEEGVYDELRDKMQAGEHPLVQNNMKCVMGWDNETDEFLGAWKSAKKASEELNIPYHWVHKGCRNEITSEYTGYIFEYDE
jgi:hypothetical protein